MSFRLSVKGLLLMYIYILVGTLGVVFLSQHTVGKNEMLVSIHSTCRFLDQQEMREIVGGAATCVEKCTTPCNCDETDNCPPCVNPPLQCSGRQYPRCYGNQQTIQGCQGEGSKRCASPSWVDCYDYYDCYADQTLHNYVCIGAPHGCTLHGYDDCIDCDKTTTTTVGINDYICI